MIRSDDTLAPWLEKIEAASVVGLDTEADSLYSYPERLCLLQLALPDSLLLVDPLSSVNLDPLWQRLKRPEVVIQAADYDLRLLARHYGFVPPRVFDTMWAARLLGFREFSLHHLVAHFHQVQLEKGARKADWGKRPLTTRMIEYALNDVRYLLPLYAVLKQCLQKAGRLEWLHEWGARLGEEALKNATASNGDAWRIKGSKGLDRQALACLKALWHWRETEARLSNKPPFFILSHQLLLQIVHRAAAGKKWETCLPRWLSIRRRREMRDCLRKTKEMPPATWPEEKKSQRIAMTKSAKNRARELETLRDTQADTLGLDPTLIASKSTLINLAQDWDNHAPQLMNWQRKLIEA